MDNPFKKAVNDEENISTEGTVASEAENKNDSESVQESESSEISVEDDGNEQEKAEENALKQKYDALNNQYLRLAADFDNYRKRNEQEREALLKYGAENTLKKMLDVIDNFERGLKAIENVEDCEKLKECYQLAYKNFSEALLKAGLEQIKAEGEVFDPQFHEAVMQTPSAEVPEHTIIAELQKGYKLGDKVLRPTLVNVATEA